MSHFKNLWRALFSILFVTLTTSTLTHADIIAEDSFTYANGGLTGKNGGTGFTEAWTLAFGSGLDVANEVVVTDGNGARGNFRTFNSPFGNTGEVWLSFDFDDAAGNNSFSGLSLMGDDDNGPSGSEEKVLIGTRRGSGVWSISFPAGGESIMNSDVSVVGAKTGVLRISLGVGATSSIELWIGDNAVNSVDVSGVPDLVFNGAWLQDVNRIRVAAGNNRMMRFDDLIIGQTAEDVGATGGSLDSDDDGLNDDEELLITLTEPDNPDSDGDGAIDGLEVILGFDPLSDSSVPPADFDLIDLEEPGTLGRYLNNNLPEMSSGTLSEGNWQNEDYYTGQGNFSELIGVVAEPRSDYLAVVEIRGTIQRVNALNRDTTQRTQVLDIRSITGGGRRVRGVAFHPNFNLPGALGEHYLYVFYQATSDADIDGFTPPFDSSNTFRRVSRFTRNPVTEEFDIGTELIMIQQVSSQGEDHPGGGLTFGKDGFLHIGFGDFESTGTETAAQPLYQDSQRIDRIFQSAILRIDVDMIGGTVSHAPTVTLQGSTGPNAVVGSSQSCPTDHAYFHHDNISGVGYFIPSDNYWVQNPPDPGVAEISPAYPAHGPALEEHQAVGLRNPWWMASDPVSGDIAIFDVGSNVSPEHEEVNILIPGGNYGWPYREGITLEQPETLRTMPPGGLSFAPVFLGIETDPLAFWEHGSNVGRNAVGGLYYRGTQWASVNGELLFGDHSSGKIWSIDYLSGGTPSGTYTISDGVHHSDNYSVRELIDTPRRIRRMIASPDTQEILFAANSNIWRLFNSGTINPDPPLLLSNTGAFSDLSQLLATEGMLKYEPEAPLWSDRAIKYRWMGVPNNVIGADGVYDGVAEQIVFSEEDEWVFPQGTVFVKQFTLPLDDRDPTNPLLQKRLETRFAVHGADGEYFYFTYKWNSDDTDAVLIPSGDTSSLSEDYIVTDSNGTTFTQTWDFPSRQQCVECHQTSSGSILGANTRQLNHFISDDSGIQTHQLATLNSLGIFDQRLQLSDMVSFLSSANISDTSATLEHRVKSYLDSNCAMCHQPGSNAERAEFDARLKTPLADSGLINAIPHAEPLASSIVRPRLPEDSVLWIRDNTVGENQMPPIGKNLVDEVYIDVLTDWIKRQGLPNFDEWARNIAIDGGPDDDFDGDGFPNGFEFLYKMDGRLTDFGNPATFINDGTEFTLSLNGGALADGIRPYIIDSVNLTDWFVAEEPGSILTLLNDTSAPDIDGVQTWQFDSLSDKGFVRFGVDTPDP